MADQSASPSPESLGVELARDGATMLTPAPPRDVQPALPMRQPRLLIPRGSGLDATQPSPSTMGTPSGYAGDDDSTSPYAYRSEAQDFAAVVGLAAPQGTAAFVLSVETPPPSSRQGPGAVAAAASAPSPPASPSSTLLSFRKTADAATQLLLSIQKARAALGGSGAAGRGESPRLDAFWSSMNSTPQSTFREAEPAPENNDADAGGATPRELFPAAASRGGGGVADALRAGRSDRAELLARMREVSVLL